MDVLDAVFGSGLGRRALVEVVLLGAIGGALAFWVASFRLSYAAESLAHGLLPGAVAAVLVGVPLLGGAAAGVVLAALLIAAAARDERIGPEAGTAVAVSALLGLGALLALAPASPPRLEELLFGDPLGASDGDLLAAALLLSAGAVALAALHRPLSAVAFDPQGARAAGVRPGLVNLALLVLVGLTVAVAVRGLGNLLALAVLVAPALALRHHVATPGGAVVAGAAVAVAAGGLGIVASFALGIAAGASVALALCLAALVGALLRPRRARDAAAAAGG